MGKKSNRRVFRRRRRRAGFALLSSLAIILLGVTLLSSPTETENTADSPLLEPVKQPLIASAPEAVEKATDAQPAAEKEPAKKEAAQKKDKPEGPPPPEDKTTYLTVPKMGLYDNAVYNSSDPATMDYGAAKLKESGFPWQDNANPYIAAHRLGWPGTASYYQFYNLPLLAKGDPIYLTDANGTTYTYKVTEIFEVLPNETWVSKPVPGKDMISLQTCTENYGDYWTMGPNWYTRYVVRGERVNVKYA